MKQTQLSAALSPGLEESAGPKMLSRSAMEGLCVSAEVSSAFTSASVICEDTIIEEIIKGRKC